jgi:DNA topoisomerase-6 subunit B
MTSNAVGLEGVVCGGDGVASGGGQLELETEAEPGMTQRVREGKAQNGAAAPAAGKKRSVSDGGGAKVDAEVMATRQKEVSVSEFFVKNRHLLGFDSPRKTILTTVKEAVDNSLDACEEAGILPDIVVVLEDLEPGRAANAKESRYRVTVVDNGPGIVRKQVENVFGRLLYGSKFHRLKMSRGQQGIGISAAGMNGLVQTGQPMLIHTKPKASQAAHHIELAMNTKTNRAEVTLDEETDDFPPRRLRELSGATRRLAEAGELLSERDFPTGTSVSIILNGKYQRGRGSVDEFLELTAIANPHARLTFIAPRRTTEDEPAEATQGELAIAPGSGAGGSGAGGSGAGGSGAGGSGSEAAGGLDVTLRTQEFDGVTVYPRGVSELPPETKEIQPHPKGIELGTLLQMLKDYEAQVRGGTLYSFLQEKFCRISASTASGFCEAIGVTSRTKALEIEPPQVEALFKVFQEARLAPPPTDCLAPIGVRQLLAGMLKGVKAEFYAASSRAPEVYRGRPFQIEAAIAFGGELAGDDSARVIRFANRVPLLFQPGACSSNKAVVETAWKNYNLQHPRGGLPVGPLVIMIHMASVWVPFTSESKEAIADYDEIRKEMKLALMECGRKLGTYLRKRQKMKLQAERRDVFQKYIGEIAKAAAAITGEDPRPLYDALLEQAKAKTSAADQVLDEDGKVVASGASIAGEEGGEDDGVVIVQSAIKVEQQGPALDAQAAAEELSRGVKRDASFGKQAEGGRGAASAGGARSNAKAKPGPDSKGKPETKGKTEAKAKPESKPTAGVIAKPKMRLVNGKLVPVDGQGGLF